MPQYNTKNPSVKRVMQEMREIAKIQSSQFTAAALEEDIFEWHFTIRGPKGSDFEGGIYHGRIILPSEYPFKPPNFVFLTPNGRFEVGKKICLSISAHHPENWQPSWSIRTVLLAIIGFMPTKGEGAIGALDYSTKERQILSKRSVNYTCNICGKKNENLLPKDRNEHLDMSNVPKFHTVNPSASPPPPSTSSSSSSRTQGSTLEEQMEFPNNGNSPVFASGNDAEFHFTNPDESEQEEQPGVVPEQEQEQHAEQLVFAGGTEGVRSNNQSKAFDYVIFAIVVIIVALLVNKFM